MITVGPNLAGRRQNQPALWSRSRIVGPDNIRMPRAGGCHVGDRGALVAAGPKPGLLALMPPLHRKDRVPLLPTFAASDSPLEIEHLSLNAEPQRSRRSGANSAT